MGEASEFVVLPALDVLEGRCVRLAGGDRGQVTVEGGDPAEAAARFVGEGARFLVVGWPAFWWLDYYAGFRDYLRSEYRPILDNDRLVVFDLGGDRRRTGAESDRREIVLGDVREDDRE